MINVYLDGTLVDSNFLYGVKQEAYLFNGSFRLGSTICKTYSLQIDMEAMEDVPTAITIEEDEVTIFAGFIDSHERYNNFSYNLTATDSMVKANYEIIANGTLSSVLNGICATIGVTAPTDYYGANLPLEGVRCTARDIISYAAEINGGYAYIDNNALVLAPFSNTLKGTISLDSCSDFELGQQHYITSVKYNGTTLGTGEAVEINPNNPLINDEVLQHIHGIVNELTFFALTTTQCDVLGDIKPGDMIAIGGYPTIAQICYDYWGQWCGGYSLDLETTYQERTSAGTKVTNTLTKAIADITQLFGGKSTGIIQFIDSDGDTVNDGIVAYDNIRPEDATNIIKITSSGLAISSDGGQTFTNAITGAGIVATAITTGTLRIGGESDDLILEIYDTEGNKTGQWNKTGLATEDSHTFLAANYSASDKTRLQSLVGGEITPTAEDYEKYDFDLDGKLTTKDYLVISRMLNGEGDYVVTWSAHIEPGNKDKIVSVDITRRFATGASSTSSVFNAFAGGVKIGGSLVDTIATDSLTGDTEGYIIYSNGIKHCWKHFTTPRLALSAIGGIYRTAEVDFGALPFEFTARPVVSGTISDGYAWLSGFANGTAAQWGKARIYYPTSAAQATYEVDLIAIGI